MLRPRSSRALRRLGAVGLPLVVVLAGSTVASPAAAAVSVPALPPRYSELDQTGDGVVTDVDLDEVANRLGTSLPGGDPLDVDEDGGFTVVDLAALSQRMVFDDGPFEIVEATTIDMQSAMNAGVLTSVQLTQQYLDRIAAYDDAVVDPGAGGRALNSVLTVSDGALDAAAAADRVRAESGMTSLLLGVPVLAKDNYDTRDMPTTAGCACWEANQTDEDATMVAGLRDAGAVILGKASLDEFAFGFSSQYSTGQPAGTAVPVASPYLTSRTAGGSSGGTGASVAANLAGIGLGTDTGGSIRVPSSYNQLVGVRPTVGLASRTGIVPLALSQDTGGPMARTVTDAAAALDVLVGVDPSDPVTADQQGRVPDSYLDGLTEGALQGARFGYVASMVGTNATTARLFREAVATLQAQGATVMEVAGSEQFTAVLGEPSGSTNEFKHDLDLYIRDRLAPEVPNRSLTAILESNRFVPAYRNSYLARNAVTPEQYTAWAGPDGTHTRAIAAGSDLLHGILASNDLDGMIYPTGTPYGTQSTNMRLSPNTGMPAVTVPMGVATAADGTITGANVNLEILGEDYSEGTLLGFAYAFEQAAPVRTPPALYGPLG